MAKKLKIKVKPNIESQEVLAESDRKSYEILRLSRVRYENNPDTFIDLRIFQRGYEYKNDEEILVYHPTKKGVQFKEDHFQKLIGKWTLVPELLFHPIIIKKAYPALSREEYDTAVFRAFKSVEVHVRKLSKLSNELIGTGLVRKAFDPDTGALTDRSLPKAEREALSHLFAGSLGCYKNPHSHRDVEITFNEAFEMLLVASHLLQVLDRIHNKKIHME